MTTATTGTGTITLAVAKNGYFTFAEAGLTNANTARYKIIDGNDFEIGIGTYTSAGTTFSRDTVLASKIAGTAGTSKINLSGTAEIFLTEAAGDQAYLAIANTFTKSINKAKGAAVASAATTDIWPANDGDLIHITGTTEIGRAHV